jgi:hypothetical protein
MWWAGLEGTGVVVVGQRIGGATVCRRRAEERCQAAHRGGVVMASIERRSASGLVGLRKG